jgi:hypothetical protein
MSFVCTLRSTFVCPAWTLCFKHLIHPGVFFLWNLNVSNFWFFFRRFCFLRKVSLKLMANLVIWRFDLSLCLIVIYLGVPAHFTNCWLPSNNLMSSLGYEQHRMNASEEKAMTCMQQSQSPWYCSLSCLVHLYVFYILMGKRDHLAWTKEFYCDCWLDEFNRSHVCNLTTNLSTPSILVLEDL